MLKYIILLSIFLAVSLNVSAAQDDTFVRDTVIGAALGVVVGSVIGGRDSALVVGLLGAAAGASLHGSGGANF
jgi:outer membrane lipoprotein SlyB